MSLPIVLRPEAEADLLSARDWYEGQSYGLRQDFTAAIEEVLDRIREMPESYGPVLRNVRRVKLPRFPYLIYYRVLGDWIEVIGVLHGSRDPRLWQERT